MPKKKAKTPELAAAATNAKASTQVTNTSNEAAWDNVVDLLIEAYGRSGTEEKQRSFNSALASFLKQELAKEPELSKYNILVLFDTTVMIKQDSDQIYQAITAFENKDKPLLMVLLSNGGEAGSAYLIGKLCREVCNKKFVVVVPRQAKSAATLLACAADEIHMGSLSELGPIDPQIDRMPALGLKNSVEHVAELVKKTPEASDMFAKYLTASVEPIQIGYYERVAESAAQYAERLLTEHRATLGGSPSDIARKLVYSYMDHGFIIDKAEAAVIFGNDTVKTNTSEYNFGNSLYGYLSRLERLAGILSHGFYFIGGLDSPPIVTPKKQ